MAEPVIFPEVNMQWVGQGDVGPLPTLRGTEDGVNIQNISCWELSAEEQIEVLTTGKVWLIVYGDNHPAVYVDGTNPFCVCDETTG